MRTKPAAEPEKKKESDAAGVVCLAGVFFIPVFLVFVFIRLFLSHGAPVWYLWLHGALCGMSILLAVIFIRLGLFPAVRDYRSGRRRERSGK